MILDILNEVAATASKNKKIEILTYHKDNKLLKEVVRLAYHPFINFYIRKIPVVDTAIREGSRNLWQGLTMLDKLSIREVTGNEAIDRLKSILLTLSNDDAEVLIRVVLKDLRAGFSDGTANKVWPKLIPSYPVMLCAQFEQKLVDKITYPAFFQLKADGARFNAIVEDKRVRCFTRQGKELNFLGVLDEAFLELAGGNRLVFDGELLVVDSHGEEVNRQTGNGILNKAQHNSISKEEAESVRAVLWDVIPRAFFVAKGKAEIPYRLRWEDLQHSYRNLSIASKRKIHLIQSCMIDNFDQATELFEFYLTQGKEGGILKDPEGIWEDKRSHSQIKFKSELDCDLLCTDWHYGEPRTENEHRLGALSLESADGKVKTRVGSGFNDDQRNTIKPEDVIGKIVTVIYNARISKRGSETDSLFLPRVKEIRFDKTIADSSKKIK